MQDRVDLLDHLVLLGIGDGVVEEDVREVFVPIVGGAGEADMAVYLRLLSEEFHPEALVPFLAPAAFALEQQVRFRKGQMAISVVDLVGQHKNLVRLGKERVPDGVEHPYCRWR